MKNDKYGMFLNFMYNDLGVSKEDIKKWTQEAVERIAKDYIKNQYSSDRLDRIINQSIEETIRNKYYAQSIREMIIEKVSNKLEIVVKGEYS